MLGPAVLKFSRDDGHDQLMAPYDFEVIISKVKVTVTLNAKNGRGIIFDKYLLFRFHLVLKF